MFNKDKIKKYITRMENVIIKLIDFIDKITLKYSIEYISTINYTNNINIMDIILSLEASLMAIRKINNTCFELYFFNLTNGIKVTIEVIEIIYSILIYLNNNHDIQIFNICVVFDKILHQVNKYHKIINDETIVYNLEKIRTLDLYIDSQLKLIENVINTL